MSQWFIEKIEEDGQWIDQIWFSDESHFCLHSAVSRKSNVYWGNEKPTFVTQRPLHSPKVTVWCALSSKGIIGPFLFENDAGDTVTVTQETYRNVIKKFVSTLKRRHGDLAQEWFQQDGATPHTAIASLELLHSHFGDRVISRRTDHPWAAHLPDLSPLDFFLWGYIKNHVYQNSPATLDELKREIRRVTNMVTQDVCKNSIDNFVKRIHKCFEQNGRHFEQL